MSVASKVGAGAVLAVAAYALLHYPSWRSQQPPRAGDGVRRLPVLLVATWQSNRDFQLSWTANGAHPAPEVDRVSPWEKEITATPGSTVTFTVTPLIGGKGQHACQIEEPPGVPLRQAHAGKTGGGTTVIMCTAVIGA